MPIPEIICPRRKTHVQHPLPCRQDGVDTVVQSVEILLAGHGKDGG